MLRSPKFLARIFRAFRYRDFRLMWTGACVSTIGTFVQQFAQSWLVYDLTKDAFYLGLDLFLGQLPIMLFSLSVESSPTASIAARCCSPRSTSRWSAPSCSPCSS